MLNISCYSLLACKVSVEKTANSLMGIPLYVTSCLSFSAFKIPSLGDCRNYYKGHMDKIGGGDGGVEGGRWVQLGWGGGKGRKGIQL